MHRPCPPCQLGPGCEEILKEHGGVRRSFPMKVNEVRPESKVDVIELTIREKGAARDFSSRSGSTGKVCDAKAVDDDGSEVSVSLWNEEIDCVQANERIRITNEWAIVSRGEEAVSPRRVGMV